MRKGARMERLTENYNGKNIVKSGHITMVFNNETGNRFEGEAVDKLAAYEDAEEQGLLLRLPCKVGDKVYEISENFIEPCTVETIFLGNYRDRNGNWCNMAEIYYDRDDCPYVSTEMYFTNIGETVFLTKEEAEAKLSEMEGAE
jgi:hypothetical protein